MKHDDLKVIANSMRKNILTMIYKAKSGHPVERPFSLSL
jgi:transketolase